MSTMLDRHQENLEMGYTDYDYAELLAHARALEAMLRECQWQQHENTDYAWLTCPMCFQEKRRGHSPDCELDRLLK